MTKRNLVVLSRRGRDSIDAGCWDLIGRSADVTVVQRDHAPDRLEAIKLLASADLIGSTNLCLPLVDADLLDGLPRLRGIVLYATGYDHLDVDLLHARGVGLSVLPDYATNAVAEHSMAMLLALSSRLHLAHDRSRGVAPGYASLRGMELFGRTLGVVGLGRIGTRVAELAGAFGMRVIGTDIDPSAVERALTRGTPMGELPWLLSGSDVVAVCASHRFGARPALGREELGELRQGALLTNVTRAALVDTAAAVAAVRSGRLRGYAVDDIVLDPAVDGDLLDSGRVLQTGHSAWWKDEVLERGSRMWGERLVAAVEGRPLDTWPGADVTERVVPVASQAGRPARAGRGAPVRSRRSRLLWTLVAVWLLVPAFLAAARWPRWWSWIAPEVTPMTWLQSVVLVLAAAGSLTVAYMLRRATTAPVLPWWLLAGGFSFLALDERFAVHERVRDGILAPRGITAPFLPWVAPGDFLLMGVAVAGLTVPPMVWRAMTPEPLARRALLVGVLLALVAVGIDSIDPSTWSVGGERLQQSFEEIIELGSGLALLTSVLCRFLGLLDGHLQPVEQAEPAGSTTKLTAEAP